MYIFVMNITKMGHLSQERQGWCFDDNFFPGVTKLLRGVDDINNFYMIITKKLNQ